MEMQTFWVDRGHDAELGVEQGRNEPLTLIAASRAASIAVPSSSSSFWIVLRGTVELECREGQFVLRPGEWISLERDSRPSLYVSRDGLVMGLSLSAALQAQLLQSAQIAVYPGRGRVTTRTAKACLGLWRRSAVFARNEARAGSIEQKQLGHLLRYVAGMQGAYRDLVDHCPGRSQRRKRQVFGRMQRAHLFLEGNLERAVRVSELAALCNVSIWYFTKTFHALYGEGPQAAAARLRLQHATALLSDTRLSVSEVGAACGFENNCSFSRAFRARYGMPPSLYRLRGWNGTPDCANTQDIGGKAVFAAGP